MAKLPPVTYELEDPIQAFGKSIDRLVIAEKLTGAGLKKLANYDGPAMVLKQIQILCRTETGEEISDKHVEMLSVDDIQALEIAMAPFSGCGSKKKDEIEPMPI